MLPVCCDLIFSAHPGRIWHSSGMASYKALADFLVETARRAGEHILSMREAREAEIKADGSPVTRADKEAEALVVAALREKVAEIGIVSEENGASHKTAPSNRFFLVDALDGTKSFMREKGKSFTVNIGLIEDGAPVLGVVYAPARERMFCGGAGLGAWEIARDGTRREIFANGAGEDGLVAAVSRLHGDERLARWVETHGITRQILMSSSLKFCLVACGEADVYPRFGPTMEWDTAAGDAVLRAAGGCVEDLEGTTLRYGKEGYRNGGFVAWLSKRRNA